MQISDKYDALIAKREKMEGDINYDNDPIIKDMVDLLTNNIEETIDFLEKGCSEKQYVWMSEIFDEIAERTKSKDFINTLRKVSLKYPKATDEYNIGFFIDSAEEYTDQI